MLSLLGVALGNRILSGRINVGDFKPCCLEWGSGDEPVAGLFDWTYLTRREDNDDHTTGENSSMIVNTECLKSGTVLLGGIDVFGAITDVERSCLGFGLKLLQAHGYIGSENRRGQGQVSVEIENSPDESVYLRYLENNKNEIMDYLGQIGAIDIGGQNVQPPSKHNSCGITKTK
jgi:hypothetical protein